jgi:predicted flap endonuclease-1-like 5' DNA nuclease
MNLEPISLGIGLVIGLPIGFLIRRQRAKKAAQEGMRDLKTRLTSLHLRLERSQNELTATKGVVARLLEERQKSRDSGQDGPGDASPLMVVLTDVDTHQLAKVRGIGPKLAVTLASYGITDLAHLADVSERDLAVIETSAPSLAERMVRERWKEQAIELLHDPDETPGDYSQIDEAQTDGYNFAKFRGPDQEEAFNGSSN